MQSNNFNKINKKCTKADIFMFIASFSLFIYFNKLRRFFKYKFAPNIIKYFEGY